MYTNIALVQSETTKGNHQLCSKAKKWERGPTHPNFSQWCAMYFALAFSKASSEVFIIS